MDNIVPNAAENATMLTPVYTVTCCMVQKLSGIFSACDAESHIPPISTLDVPSTASIDAMNNRSFCRARNDRDTICGIVIL